MKTIQYNWLKLFFIVLSLTITSHSQADDTEIFFSNETTGVHHNIMFIIDGSGSMNTEVGNTGTTRLDVMKQALKTVLTSAPDNLNVGLMNYGEDPWSTTGHGIKFPISDINTEARPIIEPRITDEWGTVNWWYSSIPEPSATITVRDYLSEITDWYWKDNWYIYAYENTMYREMERKGATPIVDAIYEAALYFRGANLGFGYGDAGYWNRMSAHPTTYTGEPINWDTDSCPSIEIKYRIPGIDFDGDDNYEWYKCKSPSDPSAPASHENCRAAESCYNESINTCDGVETPGYCLVNGELSNSCPSGQWVDATCSTGFYQTTREVCTYPICTHDLDPNPTYISPIKQECQNNYVVLLSDGKPGNDDSLTENETYTRMKSGELPTLTDKSDASNVFSHVSCDSNKDPSGFRHGICGPELSHFLANSDNSDLDGIQGIDTYAIGFGLGGEAKAEEYLKSLVTTDDPTTADVIEGYFSAEDEGQLSTAFEDILSQISSSTTSFASPGYSVNTDTGLSNEDVVYIPVFDKNITPRWEGNLKKFTVSKDASGNSVIQSKDGTRALSELGVFESSALDLWSKSETADGDEVNRGGAASLINPNKRLAVSNLSCDSNCDLTLSGNLLKPSNAKNNPGIITNEMLGLDSSAKASQRKLLINYIRGRTWNSTTKSFDFHPRMGDMLHSEPVTVTYDVDYKSKTNKQVVFAATNEGYLHAFDTITGKELFAFMPKELLKNIQTLHENTKGSKHPYGIDGNLSLWRHDEDGDGKITPSTDTATSGDKVYLYFGLRRGGRSYYALDVTDPKKPQLKWKVTSTDSKFSRLGQSWSTPYLARVRDSDTGPLKDVLIFTGGYDTKQDEESLSARNNSDSMGNDVFIVDAHTGEYIWSIQGGKDGNTPITSSVPPYSSATDLTHSIPGGARVLDMNSDGAIDRLYFADTKAQVWRLELPQGPSYDLDTTKLIKFASLREGRDGETDSQKSRIIYNEPDVGLLTHNKKHWLTVSVGTGYRSHPADESITDNFHVMLDNAVYTPLVKNIQGTGTFETLTLADMVGLEITNGALSKGEMSDKNLLEMAALENNPKSGWYLKLPEAGEKVLATSITSNGSVMFTTLVPGSGASTAVSDPCTAPLTQGRFYSMNILTGSAGNNINDDIDDDDSNDDDDAPKDEITDDDLFKVVTANEIPGTPQLFFNEPTCEGEICEQLVDIRVGKKASQIISYDAARLESVFWTNPESAD